MSESEKNRRGVLLCLTGRLAQEMFKLRLDGTIFGREKADVIIDDNEVSSTHFQIQIIKNGYHLFDMNSSNGTYLNGQKVVKAKLSDGDHLKVGKTEFQFKMIDEQNVRHIPTLFQTTQGSRSHNSIVDTLIDKELEESNHAKIVIDVTYSDGHQEVLKIPKKVLYIGRASSFGQFDLDSEISRKHLLVKLNDSGEIFIEDQKSTNGSFLNGKKISGMHKINPNDVIKVGLSKVKISTEG